MEKDFKTTEEQIEILKSRGFIIAEDKAKDHYFKNIIKRCRI